MEIRNESHRKVRLNHSNAIPRYIIAFDTETTRKRIDESNRRFQHSLRLGVAHSARIVDLHPVGLAVTRFSTGAEFWRLVEKITGPRHTTWIVGHNILFDLVQVGMAEKFEIGELVIDWPRSKRKPDDPTQDGSNSWTYLVVDEPTTIIAAKMTRTQGRIVFVDTMNWFPQPLLKIGESLGIPKGIMPDQSASNEDWYQYCERDSEITFRCFLGLIQWVRYNDFGMFRYTAPSQAMAAYRHKYMEHNIFAHDVEPIRRLERQSFFGGRSECWRIGEIQETAHQYDLSSFYPYVMQTSKFPVALDRYEIREEPLELRPDIDFYQATAEVELKTREPLFPVRTKKGVVYPIGTFTTTLCGAELGYAVRRGYVKKIGSWAAYRCESIFNKWVAELWGMRQKYRADGDNLYDMFTKFLLNSLFGKFSQRSVTWQNDRDNISHLPWSTWSEIDCTTDRLTQFRSFGWQTQRLCDREEIGGTFIAISAFVTASGRVLMNNMRRMIGNENVFYQGVDSLIVSNEGQERMEACGLVAENELGKFRHQISCDNGILYGASDYIMGERIVVAGRPKRVEQDERNRQLIRRIDVKTGLFAGGSTSTIREITGEWRRKGGYWKGKIQPDGSVLPVELS